MKNITKKLSVILIACVSVLGVGVQAQVDVTALYLKNAGFDSSCNFKTSTPSTNLASADGGANIQQVKDWQVIQIGDNSAASSFEFGYAGTINSPGSIPASGYDGSVGALGISTAWAGTVLYGQTISLPISGNYSIQYAAYNSGPNATDNSKVGWVPNSGSSVISTKTSFTLSTWSTETLNFTIPGGGMIGKIQVGINAPNVGSANVGRIFFDWVKIFYSGNVKDILSDMISKATTAYGSGDGKGASALNTAITNSQAVYNDADATDAAVVQSAVDLKSALETYNWNNASEANPVDLTHKLVNPSFEAVQADKKQAIYGWTKTGAANTEYCTRNDAGPLSGAFKTGNVYFQYWNSSKPDYSIYQTITGLSNGKYLIKANAGGDAGTTGTYVYAGDQQTQVTSTGAEYSVQATVASGSLTLGFKSVSRNVNWSYADNFRLYYLGEVPIIDISKNSISLTENVKTKKFIVYGSNLTEDITISKSASPELSLSHASISKSAAGLAEGIEVTVTFDPAEVSEATTAATITLTSGDLSKTINVKSYVNPNPSNLLGLALGNIATDEGLAPNNFGWGSTPEVTWVDGTATGYANGFRDNLTLVGSPLGRVINHDLNNNPFYFPVSLKEGKAYAFTGKASNFNHSISTTFAVNTLKDNTGTELGSQTKNAGKWDTGIAEYSFSFASSSTATHYLIWKTTSGIDRNIAWNLVMTETGDAIKVTYNTNGGSVVNPKYLAESGKITAPEAPTRGGYNFVNWYSDESLTTVWDFDTTVSADMTLYAKWDNTTGFENIKNSKFELYSVVNGLNVKASEATELKVVSLTGQIIRSLNISAGETFIQLPAGAYIINGVKALVK